MNICVRLEQKEDFDSVEQLTREAFWNLYQPGCDEHTLVHYMRDHEDFVPSLNFVAEIHGRIAGHIKYTKSYLLNEKGERLEALTFGPLCVLPEFQRQGIGSALLAKTVALAKEMPVAAIVIWGDPANYVKHGFKNCKDYLVSAFKDKFPTCLLVLELQKDVLGKELYLYHDSPLFVSFQDKTAAFDSRFPFKEKKQHYSQELFRILSRSFVQDEESSSDDVAKK
ncbi:MAG: GNAT family N-acetyltransferase [Treponemataceae bacterium]